MKTYTNTALGDLYQKIRDTMATFDAACITRWPVGSRVRFFLSHQQINPSEGTITAWWAGIAVVRMDTKGRRRYNTIKRVHWMKVVT